MDTLSELIGLLNDTDELDFKQFLKHKNKRNDVKNIDLFDLIKTDDINAQKSLYKKAKNKDAYHALRKRLQDSLLLYLSQKTFESDSSEWYDALRLLVVARFLFEHDLTKLALKCLGRAAKIAEKLEQFSLLHDIYLLRLQYVHLQDAQELEQLTERFLSNQAHMQCEAKLNLAYAFLRRELQEVNLKGKIVNLTGLILATLRKYKIALSELMTYKALYQILYIANEYAAIYQNYGLVARFVKRTYDFMQSQNERKPGHLFYHLSIIYFLANFQLRNKNFNACATYLREMNVLMDEQRAYRSMFFLRQQLLLALSLHFSGKADQALDMIERALATVSKKSKSEDVDDLRICLVMFLAQHNDRTCLRPLALLTHTDAWYEKKLGMLWTIRKNLMEIVVQAQFGHIDLAVSRLTSFKRRYKAYLLTIGEERVLHFVGFVEKYLDQPNVASDVNFQQQVLAMLHVTANTDIFNLSFIAWLIARWKKKTPYEITLELVGGG
ncbi:hypothetical protein PQ465_14870 [Sphingobacterium oryzagri]|uniref:Tetratricopeptide repeat protein n=1 Tax=Sphingobacterium oryzagri TaxID=3025669 RepID=A0ABY7WDM2_9SPHI|nr:hypothetical protein [Sphingobacterium sp. KACC 22765]WDF67580.1 hypothetical protein PQ465_14870 [Sphingobacterium sp. KACC 22765]